MLKPNFFIELFDIADAQSLFLKLAEAVTATVEEYQKTVERFEYLLESAFTNKEKEIMHINT